MLRRLNFRLHEVILDPLSQTEALRASLRKALLEYRKEKPNLSLRAIAKNSGVNRYFLMKLLDDKDDSQSLDLHQVLLLTRFITGRTTKEAMDGSTIEMKKALEAAFNFKGKSETTQPQHPLQPQLDLSNSHRFLVYLLCSKRPSCTLEDISSLLGIGGKCIANEWLQTKVLINQDGHLSIAKEYQRPITETLLRQHLPFILSLNEAMGEEKNNSHFHLIYRGLNAEAAQRVAQIQRESYRQIMNIIDQPENLGPLPFFSLGGSWSLSEPK